MQNAMPQPHRSHRLVGDILIGADADIKEYVRRRMPVALQSFSPTAVALGVVRHGRLLGGAVFDRYSDDGRDIMMSAAFDDPRWCTRKTLRALYSYPFLQLDCRRMTAITQSDNADAIKALIQMGFEHEGVLRCFFSDDQHGLLFGMLREECRWIR